MLLSVSPLIRSGCWGNFNVWLLQSAPSFILTSQVVFAHWVLWCLSAGPISGQPGQISSLSPTEFILVCIRTTPFALGSTLLPYTLGGFFGKFVFSPWHRGSETGLCLQARVGCCCSQSLKRLEYRFFKDDGWLTKVLRHFFCSVLRARELQRNFKQLPKWGSLLLQ